MTRGKLDQERAIQHVEFLLTEIRRYRLLRWPGAGVVGAVFGGCFFLFADSAAHAIALGFVVALIVEARADASLSVFRVRYAEVSDEYPEATREALARSPNPDGFYGWLKWWFNSS